MEREFRGQWHFATRCGAVYVGAGVRYEMEGGIVLQLQQRGGGVIGHWEAREWVHSMAVHPHGRGARCICDRSLLWISYYSLKTRQY